LDQVSSSTVATRDPSLAFSVVASSLTSVESAGREDRDPTQPFAIVASMPTNNKPAAAYPAPSGPPVAQPRPVAAKDLFTAAYIPLLIILAVGILLKPLSILALLAATFIPALRVSFRGRQLRVVGYILVGVVLVTWGVFWFANQGINNLDLQVTVVGQVLCAVYLFADLVLQYLGLRNGEKPSSGA
jgi:RsiW-degrading membrane proteinase PrsW (M82 family)